MASLRQFEPRSPRAVLIALVAVSTLARFGAGLLVHTPLYFPDEYLYESLARGFAHGHFAEVRGQHVSTSVTISYVVPLLTAPLWVLHDVGISYRLTQLVGSLVFSCAALPAYALARRAGVGSRPGLLVAVLSLVIPAGLFTGMVMAEPYAYPLFLVATLLAVRSVERRTVGSLLATVVAGISLIVVGGLQFGLFLPAVLAAALTVVPARRRVATASGLLIFAVASAVSVRYADQGVFAEVVGKARLLRQPFGRTATWLAINAFLLAVAAGWVTAPGAVLGFTDLTRSPKRIERFLGALSVLLLAGLLFEAATWSSTYDRAYQRFAFYGVPLILIGFVRWAECAARRSTAFAGLAYALAAAAVLVPLAAGMHVDNPYAPPLTGLAFAEPASTAVIWAPALAASAVAAGLLGHRRRGGIAALAIVIALSATTVAAAAVIRFARPLPAARAGLSHDAVYVTTSQEDPFAEMRTLFWNPNLDRLAVFGGGAPDTFGSAEAALEPDGSLRDDAGHPIRGPFVASPTVLALPSSSSRPLAVFTAPVDVLAFGWDTDGFLGPYVQLLAAGRAQGENVRLRLWSEHGRKTLILQCAGRVERLSIGRRPSSVSIRAAAHVVRSCDLRLVAGSVEAVHGRSVAVRGTLERRSLATLRP